MTTQTMKNILIVAGIILALFFVGGVVVNVVKISSHVPPTAPSLTPTSSTSPLFPMTGPKTFTMNTLTSVCVNGLPLVSATWTAEPRTVMYLLQRQFPNSSLWETTGASYALSGTDATWRLGYGPGAYAYRVQGAGVTQVMIVNIPQCGAMPQTFTMNTLTSVCVNGLPRVSATWTAESGTTKYFLQRQFPNSSLWETTGAWDALSGTDTTWQLGYGAGTYLYRVLGTGVTQAKSVAIVQCAPVAQKLIWGAYAGPSLADLPVLESLVGKPVKLVSTFFGWSDNFPSSYSASVRDQGKTLVLFWEQDTTSLDQIISGNSDAYIRQFAEAARIYGGPVLLAPFHEMNGYWTPWSGVAPGNSPAKVILAWRHVRDLFRGAPNVRFVWTVNSESVPDTAANAIGQYYPGDAYVDDVAIDGFNFGSPWQSFDAIFRAPITQLKLYNKPIYILSMASAAGTGKAAWITDALTVQIPKYPEIVGWVWFNQNKEQNWLVNSDQNSLNAFKAAIQNY